MRPAPFSYARARTVAELLGALADADGETALLAGGQSLVPAMRRRAVRPARLIDIGEIAELSFLAREGQSLRIGALCRHATLEDSPQLDGPWRALRAAAGQIGMRAIRARGTIGGSVAHADPAAELVLASVAYGAEVVLRSASASRRIGIEEFLLGSHRTALQAGEAIVEVEFPAPSGTVRSAFYELSARAIGWALGAACAVVSVDDGVVRSARVAVGGAALVPRRLPRIEQRLVGMPLPACAARDPAAGCDDVDAEHRELATAVVGRVLGEIGGGK